MKRGWTRVKFGEMAEHIAERVEPTETDGETYIGLEHLDSGSLTVLRWGTDVTLVGTKLRMRKGDILFGRRNAYLRRVAIAPHDGLFSAHGMVLRARSELVLHEFLPFFMQSDVFMERAGQISVGSVSPTINWGTLKEQEFVLPSIDEQQRIADMLHSSSVLLDRMVDVETDHDVVVRALIDAYVEQIVPDAKRLAAAGEAGPTAVLPLNDAAKVTDCKHRTPTLVDDGVPMVAPGDIRWGSLQLEGCKRIASSEYDDFMDHVTVAPGDLVLSRNQTYGVAAYVTTSDRFALGQDTVLVQGAR
jgi:type I restriction enzyme S subunit